MAHLKLKIGQFKKALATLEEILGQIKTEIIRDATIQRFEYSFELFWKMLKEYLAEEEGIEAYSPKSTFRKLKGVNFLSEKELLTCFQMTDDRNALSHLYGESRANEVYERIKTYLRIMKEAMQKIESRLGESEKFNLKTTCSD
jgi:nucleotidyltransferase substrate binding protein (TIGR01987 family)